MVKTRLTTLCSAVAVGLLLATISAAGAAGPEAETPSVNVELSKRPCS